MPIWSVSEPYLNLWLQDEPLGYQPAIGPRISFTLKFKQRERTAGYNTNVFGIGKNWNFSWFSYIANKSPTDVAKTVYFSGGRKLDFPNTNVTEYLTSATLSGTTNAGFTLTYNDGSKDVYGLIVTNSSGVFLRAFLTERWNANEQKARLEYYGFTPAADPIIRLKCIVDGDGLTNWVYYVSSNSYSTNLISQIVDPFGRSASMAYSPQGYLTNITDAAGLSSSLIYDQNGWVTNLITPYGVTSFQMTDTTGTNKVPVGRSVRVTEPDGSCQLYVYKDDAPGVASSYSSGDVPVTSPFTNTFDNSALNLRNTFHWNRQQYASLSTTDIASLTTNDYRIARMRHWLQKKGYSGVVLGTLSMERAPSPGDSTDGQKTWYDYLGKTNSQYQGAQALPLYVAQVLPDGTTSFTRTVRNTLGSVTNEVSTYTLGAGIGFRTNTFRYATNGIDLLAATNALSVRVVSNVFNAYHQVVTNFDALNQMTVYTYDANRRLTSITGPTGLITTNIYGADGFLAQTMDLGIATNSYTWSNSMILTHTDPRGLCVTNTWDALNRLRRVDYPDATFVTNTYDWLDLVRVVDRMGHATAYGYDALRRLVATTNANDVVTRNGYCGCGSLTFVTNAWNTPVEQAIQNEYDLQGNLIYEVYPDQIVTNWYDSLRRVICRGDGWGYRWFFHNNQSGLTTISNAFGIERLTAFDILDRPQHVTDANGVMITNTYDALNRLRTRGYPDAGIEKFGYSARGLIAYTNQLGIASFYAYDEARRKTFETNANFEVIRYTNGPAGDLLALADGKGQVTRWNYDEYGRVTNKVDQTGTEILRYTYDADGRLASRWSAAKETTYYTNDAVGNLVAINYPASPDVILAYDWLNRLTNMVDAVGTTKYTYSAAGRLLTEDGPFADDNVTNSYLNGLRTNLSLAQPLGLWTNGFAYDSAKRLTDITSPAGGFGYTFAGQASRLTQKLLLPNGSYVTNMYDNVARLRGTLLNKGDHTTLDSATYGYNLRNQRVTFTNAAAIYVSNRYDNLGQLTVADSSVDDEDRGYAYDAAWNLNYRTNNAALEAFTVDSKNQLTGTPGFAPGYDSNGNLTLATDAEGFQSYTFDDENRLTSMYYEGPNEDCGEDAFPVWESVFAYDGFGRLRARTDYTWNCVLNDWEQAGSVRYVYDGMRVIQERDGANTPTVSYTRGTDLSGSLEGAGGIGGLLARSDGYASGNWTDHNFYHADENGNITALVDESQALSASYQYDPYGNMVSQSGSLADANVYRFSSKEIHAYSGLYYYGYRWYVPNLQRWLNRDPIGEIGGLNLYGYVYNNPINYVDPYGLLVDPVTGTVVGVGTTIGTGSSGGAGVVVTVGGGAAGVGVGTVAVGVGGAVVVGGAIGYGASQLPVVGGGTVADFLGDVIYETFWPKPKPLPAPRPQPTPKPKSCPDPDDVQKCKDRCYELYEEHCRNYCSTLPDANQRRRCYEQAMRTLIRCNQNCEKYGTQ